MIAGFSVLAQKTTQFSFRSRALRNFTFCVLVLFNYYFSQTSDPSRSSLPAPPRPFPPRAEPSRAVPGRLGVAISRAAQPPSPHGDFLLGTFPHTAPGRGQRAPAGPSRPKPAGREASSGRPSGAGRQHLGAERRRGGSGRGPREEPARGDGPAGAGRAGSGAAGMGA